MQINIIFLLFFFFPCLTFFPLSSVDGFIFSGATAPLGFWDPLEISKQVDIGHLAFLREAELKHSRWSMVSCISVPMIESQTHYPAIHEFDSLDLRLKIAIIVLISGGEFSHYIKDTKTLFRIFRVVWNMLANLNQDINLEIWGLV